MVIGQRFSYEECKGLLTKLVLLMKEFLGEDLLSVVLYGSIARGKGTVGSDLDLIVVHKKCGKNMAMEFAKMIQELRESNEYRLLKKQGLSPYPYSIFIDESKLKKHPWILLDVLDDGIILLDKNEILAQELKKIRARLKELGSKKVFLENGKWYWNLKPDWKPGDIIEL